MSQKVKVVVNGHSYLVEVDDLSASPLVVKVNGQPYRVGVETVDEVVSVPESLSSMTSNTPVKTEVQPEPHRSGAITAPMPGNIVEVYVKVGDKISKDQQLCSLEAMKMQNAIRSSRDGVIATVAVQTGQAVGHGELLFTLK